MLQNCSKKLWEKKISGINRRKMLTRGLPKVNAKYTGAAAKSLQSCPTLCDPTDGSPRGSPIPGILQARTLEWVAISFSNIRSCYFIANRWEKNWKLWQTIFLHSIITVDDDCSHEIKRCLLLGRKAMTNLGSVLKSRDITLPTKVCIVKLWFLQ